ncbi:MAG: hypothetical protein ACRCX7_11230 [Cetobacterium sp.]|uniref:hypothetical protein n=1 Tax=Cetobacterium sp. TaxID=2071632 RepID=UPI003F3A2BAB
MDMHKENDLLERFTKVIKDKDEMETIRRVLIAMLYSTCSIEGSSGFRMETKSGLILKFDSEVKNDK